VAPGIRDTHTRHQYAGYLTDPIFSALMVSCSSIPASITLPPVSAMTYIIAEPCVDLKDASCVEVCPVDCIYEGEDMFYIHPVECIDCGACEPECPVTAIFPDTDVPPEWTSYTAKNADHFDDV
jgi:ferredoxin